MTTGADVLKLIEEKGIKYVDLRFTDTKGKEQHVTVPTRVVDDAFFEDGKGIGRSRFTLQDAQKAGLNGSDNWRKYPRNMLFARALSNGVKWYCPDVTGGPAYTPDELGAVVDEDGEVIEAEVVERPTPPIHQPVADQSRRIQTGPVQPPPEPPAQPDNGHEAVPLKPSEVDALIEYARTLRPDLKDAVRAHLSNSCLKACGLTDWTDAMLGGLEQAVDVALGQVAQATGRVSLLTKLRGCRLGGLIARHHGLENVHRGLGTHQRRMDHRVRVTVTDDGVTVWRWMMDGRSSVPSWMVVVKGRIAGIG